MNMDELLRKCRFSKRYQGYYAFRECLLIALENEETLLYVTGIYKDVARKLNISWKLAERNIRTMLDCSWKTGGRRHLEELSGGTLYDKPTISEVLEILVCYLKEHPAAD